tara:strand:- start:170 stop:640 length:471 start_codon:yes stop_codon:yes gene_type:complete
VGSIFLRAKSIGSNKVLLRKITLHELIHAQGHAFDCVPGGINQRHYSNRDTPFQLNVSYKLGPVYMHKFKNCPQLADSVYLTPTSKDPYDPYKILCLDKLGKYTHKKIMKKFNKQIKKNKRKPMFTTQCKWQMGPKDAREMFTDKSVLIRYNRKKG